MFIVSLNSATGNPKEVMYLAQLPELLKNGKYNEYGIVRKAKQALKFATSRQANWHAKRREQWLPSVIKVN